MISDYITDKEYRCRCCNELPVDFYAEGSLGEISPPYLLLFKYFKDIREAWASISKTLYTQPGDSSSVLL